jgi:hypothetical protein
MQTITERYGRKRLTIFFVCVFVVLGVIGVVRFNSSDGPPSCAHHFDTMTRNSMVDCMNAVEKWCADNHPEDPDGCSNAVDLDGDARNVGKD